MVSDKLNSSSVEEKLGKYEIIAQLSRFAKEHGNPIVVKDFGVDSESELIKDNKIKEKVLEGLDEEKIDKIKYSLEIFKFFLKRITFTDGFDLDHESRRNWETAYIEKGKLSLEAKERYYSNRLNSVTGWNTVISEITELEETILNEDIIKELENLKNEIPREFYEKYELPNGVKVEMYHRLLKDEKVKVVNELSKIVEKIILLLEEK